MRKKKHNENLNVCYSHLCNPDSEIDRVAFDEYFFT